MDSSGAIAKPYARAAFAYAREHAALGAWSAALKAAAGAAESDAMQTALDSPETGAQALALLCELAEGAADDQPQGVANLLRVMRENRRLGSLGEVARQFEALRREDARRVEAVMVTAAPVPEAQQAEVARALEARLDRAVDFRVEVDEGLLGGARIRVGDRVLDGSARAGLQDLAAALARPATR
ncbi:F0F1 ATP synthase subunit delta [Candidatus Foliamicus sp.]